MAGNGKNGKYTAQQFIDAIPGTGGVVSAIADSVGCAWNTAKKYIDEYATVNQAWQNERNRITDRAEHNIVGAINRGDLAMSKWWLQVMRDEFVPKERREFAGEVDNRIVIEYVNDWRPTNPTTEPA
jgi:hypothetical protein